MLHSLEKVIKYLIVNKKKEFNEFNLFNLFNNHPFLNKYQTKIVIIK